MARLTKRAVKDLKRLPERLSAKALEIIGRLDDEPARGLKLKGALKGKRSTLLGKSHRIIYETSGGTVIILAIRHRKDAYR